MLICSISHHSGLVINETDSCELVLFTAINEDMVKKQQHFFPYIIGFVVEKILLVLSIPRDLLYKVRIGL